MKTYAVAIQYFKLKDINYISPLAKEEYVVLSSDNHFSFKKRSKINFNNLFIVMAEDIHKAVDILYEKERLPEIKEAFIKREQSHLKRAYKQYFIVKEVNINLEEGETTIISI